MRLLETGPLTGIIRYVKVYCLVIDRSCDRTTFLMHQGQKSHLFLINGRYINYTALENYGRVAHIDYTSFLSEYDCVNQIALNATRAVIKMVN